MAALQSRRVKPVVLKCELKALKNSPIYDKPMPMDRSERREKLAQPKILLRELGSEEVQSPMIEPLVRKRKLPSSSGSKLSSSSLVKTPSPKIVRSFEDKESASA